LLRVKKGKQDLIIIDAALPDVEYTMAQYLAMNLFPIQNPTEELEKLRKRANWLEKQLVENGNE